MAQKSKTPKPPVPAGFFKKVAQAREALKEKSHEILELYMENARKAAEAGDYEVAMKSLQWLLEHMPADSDGSKVVDTSVDKQPKQVERGSGTQIKIGIMNGGQAPKQIPSTTTVEVIEDDDA